MPALIDARLAYLRYTTKAFIEDDPVTLTFNRQVKVKKPGGGHDFPTVAVAPQKFRFINQSIDTGVAYSQSDDVARRSHYVIVGLHDADVEINDNWVEGEQQYRVESMVPHNGWETRAYVIAFAKEPNKG